MHQIEQVNEKRVFEEVFTDHLEDCTFKKEAVASIIIKIKQPDQRKDKIR
jgi:hypothetical protein